MKKPAIAALVLLVNACTATSQPSPDAAVSAVPPSAVFGSKPPIQLPVPGVRAAPADGFEVRMQRSACYGICPAYELILRGSGAVDFRGIAHVAVSGEQHGQADAQALAALRAQLSDPAFELWGSYTRGKPACGAWATDMPAVSIDAYVGDRWQHIGHDLGCYQAPAALKALEQAIDAAGRSEQWVSGRSSY
jgi:hypothetical protein